MIYKMISRGCTALAKRSLFVSIGAHSWFHMLKLPRLIFLCDPRVLFSGLQVPEPTTGQVACATWPVGRSEKWPYGPETGMGPETGSAILASSTRLA